MVSPSLKSMIKFQYFVIPSLRFKEERSGERVLFSLMLALKNNLTNAASVAKCIAVNNAMLT